jgi:hypothetical protein
LIRVRKGNVRVYGINEAINRVLIKAHVGRERDGRILRASTHLQQPQRKGMTVRSGVKTHVLSEVEDGGGLPEMRAGDGSTDDLLSGSLGNNREDLAKVTTKDNSDASKRTVRLQEVLEGAIKSLNGMTMLHGSFIPDDDGSLLQETMMVRVGLQATG